MTPATRRHPLDILLIEERTVECIDLETKLEDLGHRVVAVANHLEQALARLDDAAERPDGVLLNPRLVGRSARPVAERLARRGIPYVLLTGESAREMHRLGFRGPRLAPPARTAALASALREMRAMAPRPLPVTPRPAPPWIHHLP